MGRLPDHLWRRFIEMMLIAGEGNRRNSEGEKGDTLPTVADMAWTLHIDAETLQADVDEMVSVGLLSCREDGMLIVTNFTKRQSAMSDVERQRRYRDRSRRDTYYGHDAVTVRDSDRHEPLTEAEERQRRDREEAEAEAEAETDRDDGCDPRTSCVFQELQTHGILVANVIAEQKWIECASLDTSPDLELFSAALIDAQETTGKLPTIKYVRRIMTDCIAEARMPGRRNNGASPRASPYKAKPPPRKVTGVNPLTGERFTTEIK